jgi:hypothetical protein
LEELLMNTNTIMLITFAGCAILSVLVTVGAQYLTKHGKNAQPILADIDKGIGYAQSIANAVKPFLPNIADNVIDVTLKYASQAITSVEATYKAALVTGAAGVDTRQAQATTMIQTALAMQGIPMTTDTQKLIDTVIPLLVMALPKTNDVTAAAPTVTTAPDTAQTAPTTAVVTQ